MHAASYTWLIEEAGQDLTEYTLLLAFVALIAGALFLYNGAAVNQIWSSANSYLALGGS